jgi:CheY-like chemotaxis protein
MIKKVLLADDDEDDRLLFEEVFQGLSSNQYKLECVDNGLSVLSALSRVSEDGDLPLLIILDQNMPLMSGKETLMNLKSSTHYHHIPVIIYSTYNDKNFIDECHRMGAASVESKPDTYEGYMAMIRKMIKDV